MNYKESLFFIGKCLTISDNYENKVFVEKELKFERVDWKSVIKISSSHLIMPAIYIKLKEMELLKYLEKDLVFFLEDITNLNRDRNLKIINQAKQINSILLKKNIIPVFIKGTAYLLNNLYSDIAERMVGDIDFIVKKDDYEKTITILKESNYNQLSPFKNPFPHTRHYTRLVKKKELAAVEIHDELTIKKYFKEFNYKYISKEIYTNSKKESFLNYKHQLCMSIISTQVNDKGYLFKKVSLKNSYDVFLLSKKTNSKNAISSLKRLKPLLNYYLAISYEVLGKPKEILWCNNQKTISYKKKFYKNLENMPILKFKLLKLGLKTQNKLTIITKVFYNTKMRKWFFELITSKEWLKKLNV
jgi:hypothetical protein